MSHCIKYLATLILILVAGITKADLGDELDRMFEAVGTMSAVTDPGLVESDERNLFSGGSVDIKFPRSNSNKVVFTPPNISAGCGGLSMFGGSFSFANKDEFVQLLRNVAANASGYLFQLALSSMCSSCAELMDKIQEKISKMNQFLRGECGQIQEFFATKGADENGAKAIFGNSAIERLARDAVTSGVFADHADAEDVKQKSTTKDELADDQGVDLSINPVWEAMKQSNVEEWEWILPGGNEDFGLDFMELLMNTVDINIYKKDPGAGTDEEAYRWLDQIKAPLDFSVLLRGGGDDEVVWNCPTDETERIKCLDLTENTLTNQNFGGVLGTVKSILVGNKIDDFGLVGKLRLKNVELDPDEEHLLAMIPSNLKDALIQMQRNRALAGDYAEYVSAYVSIEITRSLLEDFLEKIESASTSIPEDARQVVLKSLEKAHIELRDDLTIEYERLKKPQENIEYMLHIQQLLTNRI